MVSIRPRQSVAAGPAVEGSNEYTIHTDNLFDSYKKAFVSNISVTVDKTSGLIKKVFERSDSIQNSMRIGDVNLGGLFIMPGFVDAHAHIFLHPYT
jgi:imidazolonepropionase-like amidohydrolase